jgi:hypothetical protein
MTDAVTSSRRAEANQRSPGIPEDLARRQPAGDDNRNATNEANDSPDDPTRSLQLLLTPVLLPLVLLLAIKMTAAWATPPKIDDGDLSPQRTQSTQRESILPSLRNFRPITVPRDFAAPFFVSSVSSVVNPSSSRPETCEPRTAVTLNAAPDSRRIGP